jgi:hypothetical protein
MGQMLDRVYDRFYQSFGQAGFSPRRDIGKLVCVCLDSYNQFDAYGRSADGMEASWMDGYYSYQTNRVAFVRSSTGALVQPASAPAKSPRRAAANAPADPGPLSAGVNVRTATHELAHQLAFNSGLQNRGATYPFWLTEGLAMNFEATSADSCGLCQSDSRYRARLADARSRGVLIPLERFVGMTEVPTGSAQAIRDAYAQAWGLFAYLFEHHRTELVKYLADVSKAWPGSGSDALRRRFIDAFGPLDRLERDMQSSGL